METYGYKNLRIWQIARELVIDIHQMTLDKLPKFEMYEEASQIRRSIKSAKSNIVEGWGRRRYKADYIRFLDFANASVLESIDHLETLLDTRSLTDHELFDRLHGRLTELGKAMHGFIRSVEARHNDKQGGTDFDH